MVQNPFKTVLKGALLLHLKHNLSASMKLWKCILYAVLMNDKTFLSIEFSTNPSNNVQKRALQNGRHEITEVSMYLSIIEIETRFFHQTTRFRSKRCYRSTIPLHDIITCITHKFKIAAITSSLKLSYRLQYISDGSVMFCYQGTQYHRF